MAKSRYSGHASIELNDNKELDMAKFNQTLVTCSQNGKAVLGDILQKTDKALKVALVGTNLTINLQKDLHKKLYIGNAAGLEFTSSGEST